MWFEILRSLLLLIIGMSAISCAQTAWYLTTPAGMLYWEQMQERRRQNKIFRDLMNGKDKA